MNHFNIPLMILSRVIECLSLNKTFRLDICDFKMAEPSTATDGTAGKCVNDYLKFEANSDLFMVCYKIDTIEFQLNLKNIY